MSSGSPSAPNEVIVKVEFIDYDSGLHTVRISSEDGAVEQYSDATPKLIKRMAESSKRYFYARVRHGNVSLAGYAPWQAW